MKRIIATLIVLAALHLGVVHAGGIKQVQTTKGARITLPSAATVNNCSPCATKASCGDKKMKCSKEPKKCSAHKANCSAKKDCSSKKSCATKCSAKKCDTKKKDCGKKKCSSAKKGC